MNIIVDIINAIVDLYDQIQAFLTDGIYTLLTQFVAWFIKWSVVAMWKIKLAILNFSWDVAQEILISLHLSDYMNTALGSLNVQVFNMLQFFRIPEGINIILSAGVTKFIMRFLGM